jgi:hypothetical protein
MHDSVPSVSIEALGRRTGALPSEKGFEIVMTLWRQLRAAKSEPTIIVAGRLIMRLGVELSVRLGIRLDARPAVNTAG